METCSNSVDEEPSPNWSRTQCSQNSNWTRT